MKKGKYLCSVTIVAIMLLWSAVYAGSALAEINLGGRLETNIVTSISPNGGATYTWIQHLNLEMLIPAEQNLSGKIELDLYSNWNSQFGAYPLTTQLSKLYLKQRFEHIHLTVGRQPISWTFGSLLNPVDYSVTKLTGSALHPDDAVKSYDGVAGYVPLGRMSDLTMVVSFPEQARNAKFAVRGRTQVGRFEVGVNCIRDVFTFPILDAEGQIMGRSDQIRFRLAGTAKGDLGPVGIYGAAGTVIDSGESTADFLGMVGIDTSIPVAGDSKLMAQLEYLYDQTQLMQDPAVGPHLLVGAVNYEIDEFASFGIAGLINPTDKSFLFAPMYKNQIGDGLDFTLSGAYLGGDPHTQFGPVELLGFSTPRTMVQVGLGYTF